MTLTRWMIGEYPVLRMDAALCSRYFFAFAIRFGLDELPSQSGTAFSEEDDPYLLPSL